MSTTATHVVKKSRFPTPFSVTYCDKANCARVFSATESGDPLELQLGGFMHGQMAVRLKGVMYQQSSDKIPLKDFPFVKTTWGMWKMDHPSTRIYLGNRKAEYLKPAVQAQ